MSPREAKLEEALKAAIRMRKSMKDIGPIMTNLLVPRDRVNDFDALMESLKERKDDGSE